MENTYGEYLFDATSGLIMECMAGIYDETYPRKDGRRIKGVDIKIL